jgi:hypothetical protein
MSRYLDDLETLLTDGNGFTAPRAWPADRPVADVGQSRRAYESLAGDGTPRVMPCIVGPNKGGA